MISFYPDSKYPIRLGADKNLAPHIVVTRSFLKKSYPKIIGLKNLEKPLYFDGFWLKIEIRPVARCEQLLSLQIEILSSLKAILGCRRIIRSKSPKDFTIMGVFGPI